MPHLNFQLTNRHLKFEGCEKTDVWECDMWGICEKGAGLKSFTVKSGDNLYNAFGCAAHVFINERPTRTARAGLPANKPFDKDDNYRDSIHVTCPDQVGDKPYFSIQIYLPPGAYRRVVESDWTKETLSLSVETILFGGGITYGDDPDGREIEWHADTRRYEFLKVVRLHFLSADHKSRKSKEESKTTETVGVTPILANEMLASVDRAVVSILELRASISRATWVMAFILLITALIR